MTITLDNQTFPVRASMRAWRNFENETGHKVAKIDSEDVTMMPELLYYFVQEGCRKQGMKFELSVDDFLGLIDVADLTNVMKVIEESMSPGGEKNPDDDDSKPLEWDEIEQLGLGLLGLNPDTLYDFTFRQFGNAVRGRYKQQEAQHRDDWERTRWQTALLLNVHTKKGASIKPKDLATFPWEKQEKKIPSTAGTN